MPVTNNLHNNIGRYWTDQPQSIALTPDCFIFLTGGFHLAISVGWSFRDYNLHFQISWFVGIVIGCLIAPFLINWLRRRFFIYSSALLVNVSAIIAIAASSHLEALVVVRYLNGIAIGLTTVSFIKHASEIASEYHRGFCLSLEQLCLTSGVGIQIVCMSNWLENYDLNPFCLQGILCLTFGVIALLTTYYTTIDSPVQHLLKGNEIDALNCVVRLYSPPIMTTNKQIILNKLKQYVLMNESLTPTTSFLQGLSPLARLLPYRAMLALIIALPVTKAFIMGEEVSVAGADENWPPIMFGFVGVIGALVGITTMDAIGRKAVSLFSLLCVGAVTVTVGIILHDPETLANSTRMAIVCSLLMIAQIFGGIFAPSTAVYLGEAFPLQWKCFFIAFSIIVQQMASIVIVCVFTTSAYSEFVFCITTGVLMVAGVCVFALTVPETRKNTLEETQEKFRKLVNLKFY